MELPPELQAQLAPQGLQPGEGPVAQPGGQQKMPLQPITGMQGEQQGDVSGQQLLDSGGDFRQLMASSAQGDPVQDFFGEIMAMGNETLPNGLDDIGLEPDVESELDERSGVNEQIDPVAEIGAEQMQALVLKFNAIPPERKHEVVDLFRKELDPGMFRKLEAVVRLMSGRDTQVQATGVA
jgi:hypothetical protein